MTTQQKLSNQKLSLLELGDFLNNVSDACVISDNRNGYANLAHSFVCQHVRLISGVDLTLLKLLWNSDFLSVYALQ